VNVAVITLEVSWFMHGKCTYCGEVGKLTKDHVPPQNIYSKPTPDSMPWVPACAGCNGGASKDDEYFGFVMTSRGEGNANPAAESKMDKIIRSLERPQAEGYAASIFSSIRRENILTPGGVYLPNQYILNADLDRLLNVISRTTRGLHFFDIDQNIPTHLKITSYVLDQTLIQADPLMPQLLAYAANTEPKVIQPDVFSYWMVQVEGRDSQSFWIQEYFNCTSFLSLVAPEHA